MSFDEFNQQAWNDHADHPQAVADRLAHALVLVETPEQMVKLANLATHVYAEHLGQWQNGIRFLDSMRSLNTFSNEPNVISAINRSCAAITFAQSPPGEAAHSITRLDPENQLMALALAASILVGQKRCPHAISAYQQALELAASTPNLSPAAHRSLAVGGNNLAAELEEKKDRSGAETRGMVMAAKAALTYWALAGTWLEVERAHYRLARSLLQAGQAAAAVENAQHCVGICVQNQAPAFELFFGHAVLAISHRAAGDLAFFAAARVQAMALFEQIDAGERAWCEAEIAELNQ
jgi:tetratricopeptide (TPR) repeat protein